MSNSGRKKVSLWDGIIEHEEEVASQKTQAINAGVKAFEAHKERLLSILRNAWERGPKSEPLNADQAWRHLTSLAFECFRRKTLKQEVVPAADRGERLGKIAKVLGEACRLFDEAKRDDLINDLYSAWWDQNIKDRESPKVEVDPDGSHVLVLVPAEFAQIIATLSTLHVAACKARDEVVPQEGRPKGSILPPDIIDTLAHNYQQSTRLKLDKLTDKHFVEFVGTFLEALGEARKRSKDYALEAIKYSLRLKRKKVPRVGE
jgi:hypothetical protein